MSHPCPTPRLMSHCRGDTRLTSWPQGRTSPVVQSAPPSSRWDEVLAELFFVCVCVVKVMQYKTYHFNCI